MAIRALSLSKTRRYVSDLDPGKGTPDATVFILGALDSRIYSRLRDMGSSVTVDRSRPDDEASISINNGEVIFEGVSYGLKGWEGFLDDEGHEVPFRTKRRHHGGQGYDVVDPELMKLIPSAVLAELFEVISADNTVTATEAKN